MELFILYFNNEVMLSRDNLSGKTYRLSLMSRSEEGSLTCL